MMLTTVWTWLLTSRQLHIHRCKSGNILFAEWSNGVHTNKNQCSHLLAIIKLRYHDELVMFANAGYLQMNKNRQYSWSYSHRSHRTCRSPWSWSGRWEVWCTRSRRSSSRPLTAAHKTRRPAETGSLPCLAPVEEDGERILSQFTNRNISSKVISAKYWSEALKMQPSLF